MAKTNRTSLAGWGVLAFVAFFAFLRYPGLILIIFGLVVLYYFYRWKLKKSEYKKILQSGIREIDVMQGVEFENYLEVLFSCMGYKVETTRATGDFGADLILKKDGQTIAVQAKRYSKTVGVEAV